MKRTINAHEYFRDIVVGNVTSYLYKNVFSEPNPKYDNLRTKYDIINYWQIKDIRVERNIIIIDFRFILYDTKKWIDWSLCYYVRDNSKFRLEHDYAFNSTFLEGISFLSYNKFITLISIIAKSIQIKDQVKIIFDCNSNNNTNDNIISNNIDLIELENLHLYENLSLNKENFNEVCFNFLVNNSSNIYVEHIIKDKICLVPAYNDDPRQYLLPDIPNLTSEYIIGIFKEEYCGEDGWYTHVNSSKRYNLDN